MDFDPFGFPRFSLASDPALRREVKAALAANGVRLALGENLAVMPGPLSTDAWKVTLDLLGEMGAAQFNSVSFEPDRAANIDKYGTLAELAEGYGARVLMEFVPIFGVPDLPSALEIIGALGAPNLGLIFDAMHAARSGLTPLELREVPAEHIGYIQLCDIDAGGQEYLFLDPGYMDEAMHQRCAIGQGELPLAAFLEALPQDRIVSLEIPDREAALAGRPLRDTLGQSVTATRNLLEAAARGQSSAR
jgi:sugar phosphate isomerase/epimerase